MNTEWSCVRSEPLLFKKQFNTINQWWIKKFIMNGYTTACLPLQTLFCCLLKACYGYFFPTIARKYCSVWLALTNVCGLILRHRAVLCLNCNQSCLCVCAAVRYKRFANVSAWRPVTVSAIWNCRFALRGYVVRKLELVVIVIMCQTVGVDIGIVKSFLLLRKNCHRIEYKQLLLCSKNRTLWKRLLCVKMRCWKSIKKWN